MGRRRVSEGTGEATAPTTDPPKPEEPKPSAAERTIDMFDTLKLGTAASPAAREDEIRKSQDDAIARARARAVQEAQTKPKDELEKKLLSEDTLDYDKAEREAIQEEARKAEVKAAVEAFSPQPKKPEALDPAAFFGHKPKSPDPIARSTPRQPTEPTNDYEGGDEVEVTKPEEMYGKTGTFCSYRVGPFRLKARTKPGQTRMELFAILYAEVNAMADIARETEKAKFLSHLPGAFTSSAPAATS